jgi:hypothetical protein
LEKSMQWPFARQKAALWGDPNAIAQIRPIPP